MPDERILVVDDSLISQRVAAAMLESLGFTADVAADGEQAVSSAGRVAYAAILMNCQLPVLDGWQATLEIRREPGPSRGSPIIAVTASLLKSDEQRCLAAGMNDYLAKPLRLERLAAVLARWLPAGPALDARVVSRLERLGHAAGEDLVGQLATLFLADADCQVVTLRRALAADDLAAVARSAHGLRGASANLGANDLARVCATLAADSAAGDLFGGGALLDAVEAELGRVRSALSLLTP